MNFYSRATNEAALPWSLLFKDVVTNIVSSNPQILVHYSHSDISDPARDTAHTSLLVLHILHLLFIRLRLLLVVVSGHIGITSVAKPRLLHDSEW